MTQPYPNNCRPPLSICLERLGVFMRNGTDPDQLKKAVEAGSSVISIDGLTSIAAKSFVLSQAGIAKPVVILADSNQSMDVWDCDLRFWNRENDARIATLPSFETDVYSGGSPHAETM